MNRSEGSRSTRHEAWKSGIDPDRTGAAYFLSLKGSLLFKPLDYVSSRGLTLSEAQRLLPAEWAQWIQDLKTNSYEHVRRRAAAAPSMTVDDIYDFYKSRIVDSHELEILGESSRQVVGGGHELGSLLQDRQSMYLWLLLLFLLLPVVVSYIAISLVVSDRTHDDIHTGDYVSRSERVTCSGPSSQAHNERSKRPHGGSSC